MNNASSLPPLLALSLLVYPMLGLAQNDDVQELLDDLPTLDEIAEDAARAQRELNEENADNPRYQHEKAGDEALAQQRLDDAIREFDAALAVDPSAETVYVKRGIALYQSQRADEAIADFDKAMEVTERGDVWLWWPMLHKGVALASVGRSGDAIAALNGSISRNPSADAYLWRAISYGQLNRLDEVSRDIEAGLRLSPQDQRLLAVSAELDRVRANQAFLEEMAARDGARVSSSGLIYFELETGSGPSPTATDTVTVHYHGTFPDGTVFDSSVDRGTPVSFPLNGVIPCWTEGLTLMRVGGKARLVCPAQIAYGASGVGDVIPPGATLVFDVDLLGID